MAASLVASRASLQGKMSSEILNSGRFFKKILHSISNLNLSLKKIEQLLVSTQHRDTKGAQHFNIVPPDQSVH
jgi:hypothetical protein